MGALTSQVLWAAFALAVVFGAIAQRTHFCTMGAVADIVNIGDWSRMRMWVLAIGVAMIGFNAMVGAGWVEAGKSIYAAPRLTWLSAAVGGLMFGFGMVFSGGCASRNLARVGGGDLRALFTVIVVGLSAYMAIGGILGPARAALEQATAVALKTPSQAVGDLVAGGLGWPAAMANRAIAAVLVAAGLLWCLKDADFRASPMHVVAGLGVGLAAVAGWALTGLAFDDLAERPTQPVSLTFVRPSGDAIEWLARFTAQPMPGFGVATVFGTIFGAFAAAKAMGRFRLATFSDTGDTLRNLMGAVLMGTGGVLALGCTVGQAITGLSTLAAGSFLTFAAIVAGGFCGLKMLERWLMAEA